MFYRVLPSFRGEKKTDDVKEEEAHFTVDLVAAFNQ